MSIRTHRSLLALLFVVGTVGIAVALSQAYQIGVANAAPPPALIAAPVHAAVVQAPIDPTTNPLGFLAQLGQFAHSAWPVAVLLGLWGLLEIAVKFGPSWAWLRALDKGRATLLIAAAASVIAAALGVLLGGGQWAVALWAAASSALALWHPAMPKAAG